MSIAISGPAAIAFGLALAGLSPAADKGPAPSRAELTPESLPQVLSLVRPQENEWRHLQVHWLTDVVAARKQATKEDKPIVVLYSGGAGYNEPLGVC
jgi:hypothetical protein